MKAVCLAPFEDFERKTKELIAMIDRPVLEIDAQIKKFDELFGKISPAGSESPAAS